MSYEPTSHIKWIEEKIKRYDDDGIYEFCIGYVAPECIARLRKVGYTVTYTGGHDPWLIQWEPTFKEQLQRATEKAKEKAELEAQEQIENAQMNEIDAILLKHASEGKTFYYFENITARQIAILITRGLSVKSYQMCFFPYDRLIKLYSVSWQ